MTIERELERFYGDLRPDPEAERRVIAAVTRPASPPRRWRPVLVVALSAAAIAAASVLVAVMRPAGPAHSPVRAVHGGLAGAHAIHGVVTDGGVPVVGAQVSATLAWRDARYQSVLTVPTARATTDGDGAFTMSAPDVPAVARGGMTISLHVEFPGGWRGAMGRPIRVAGPVQWPVQLVVDLATDVPLVQLRPR